MSSAKPPSGPTWASPIWYRHYRIFTADSYVPHAFGFTHDDYDGPGDKRHGYADSIDEAKAEIDRIEDED